MSASAILCLGLLSTKLLNQRARAMNRWFTVTLIGILSIFLMAGIDYYGGISITGAGRFVGLMSPLTLIPAIEIAKIFNTNQVSVKGIQTQNFIAIAIYFLLVILGTNSYATFSQFLFLKVNQRFSQYGFWWVIIASVLFLGFSVLLAMLSQLARITSLWKSTESHWKHSLQDKYSNSDELEASFT